MANSQQTETTKEAILSTKLDFLSEQVNKLDIKLDVQNKHFDTKFNEISSQSVTQAQFVELKRTFEIQLGDQRRELELFRKRVSVNYIGVAVLVALFTALIYSQFSGGHL
jgi:hypothetical protein